MIRNESPFQHRRVHDCLLRYVNTDTVGRLYKSKAASLSFCQRDGLLRDI